MGNSGTTHVHGTEAHDTGFYENAQRESKARAQEDREAFFFDSYAQTELIKGNPSYAKYRKAAARFTQLNVFEVYEWLARVGLRDQQQQFSKKAEALCVGTTLNDMRLGARMQLQFIKSDMSMTDCVGYVVSQRLGMKFLTGDKEFRGLPNVEFVQ